MTIVKHKQRYCATTEAIPNPTPDDVCIKYIDPSRLGNVNSIESLEGFFAKADDVSGLNNPDDVQNNTNIPDLSEIGLSLVWRNER